MRGEFPQAGESYRPAVPTAYHDRIRSPAETVELMRPHFPALGITRVARQTGLDRVGIPCFAAFRPNSCSIATNQGKGTDDDAAKASAVMEAVEYAIAEAPTVAVTVDSAAGLLAHGRELLITGKALPVGEALEMERPIGWLGGTALRDGSEVLVPRDAAVLSGERPDLPTICQNTNGLASGNTSAEAVFHGICELIERDGNTLWSFLDIAEKQRRCVAPASFGDDLVLDLIARFEAAGLAVRLFDQTTDLGVPTILAVTAPADGIAVKHFDVAAGAGTHPNAARAALRAITEAAQTRITSIAASRDDIRPDTYRLDGSREAFDLVAAIPVASAPVGDALVRSSAEGLLIRLVERLAQHGIDDLVAVPLGGDAYGVSVVHVFSETLEDRGPNANWKPGKRALKALLG